MHVFPVSAASRTAMVMVLLALGACASVPRESDAARLSRLQAFAGPPVNSILYTSTGSGFDVVDDSHVLLMLGPRRNYLLRVDPQCLAWDGASPTLMIRSGMTGQLSVNFDAIVTRSPPGLTCAIREIRPVDLKAAREAEKQAAG